MKLVSKTIIAILFLSLIFSAEAISIKQRGDAVRRHAKARNLNETMSVRKKVRQQKRAQVSQTQKLQHQLQKSVATTQSHTKFVAWIIIGVVLAGVAAVTAYKAYQAKKEVEKQKKLNHEANVKGMSENFIKLRQHNAFLLNQCAYYQEQVQKFTDFFAVVDLLKGELDRSLTEFDSQITEAKSTADTALSGKGVNLSGLNTILADIKSHGQGVSKGIAEINGQRSAEYDKILQENCYDMSSSRTDVETIYTGEINEDEFMKATDNMQKLSEEFENVWDLGQVKQYKDELAKTTPKENAKFMLDYSTVAIAQINDFHDNADRSFFYQGHAANPFLAKSDGHKLTNNNYDFGYVGIGFSIVKLFMTAKTAYDDFGQIKTGDKNLTTGTRIFKFVVSLWKVIIGIYSIVISILSKFRATTYAVPFLTIITSLLDFFLKAKSLYDYNVEAKAAPKHKQQWYQDEIEEKEDDLWISGFELLSSIANYIVYLSAITVVGIFIGLGLKILTNLLSIFLRKRQLKRLKKTFEKVQAHNKAESERLDRDHSQIREAAIQKRNQFLISQFNALLKQQDVDYDQEQKFTILDEIQKDSPDETQLVKSVVKSVLNMCQINPSICLKLIDKDFKIHNDVARIETSGSDAEKENLKKAKTEVFQQISGHIHSVLVVYKYNNDADLQLAKEAEIALLKQGNIPYVQYKSWDLFLCRKNCGLDKKYYQVATVYDSLDNVKTMRQKIKSKQLGDITLLQESLMNQDPNAESGKHNQYFVAQYADKPIKPKKCDYEPSYINFTPSFKNGRLSLYRKFECLRKKQGQDFRTALMCFQDVSPMWGDTTKLASKVYEDGKIVTLLGSPDDPDEVKAHIEKETKKNSKSKYKGCYVSQYILSNDVYEQFMLETDFSDVEDDDEVTGQLSPNDWRRKNRDINRKQALLEENEFGEQTWRAKSTWDVTPKSSSQRDKTYKVKVWAKTLLPETFTTDSAGSRASGVTMYDQLKKIQTMGEEKVLDLLLEIKTQLCPEKSSRADLTFSLTGADCDQENTNLCDLDKAGIETITKCNRVQEKLKTSEKVKAAKALYLEQLNAIKATLHETEEVDKTTEGKKRRLRSLKNKKVSTVPVPGGLRKQPTLKNIEDVEREESRVDQWVSTQKQERTSFKQLIVQELQNLRKDIAKKQAAATPLEDSVAPDAITLPDCAKDHKELQEATARRHYMEFVNIHAEPVLDSIKHLFYEGKTVVDFPETEKMICEKIKSIDEKAADAGEDGNKLTWDQGEKDKIMARRKELESTEVSEDVVEDDDTFLPSKK